MLDDTRMEVLDFKIERPTLTVEGAYAHEHGQRAGTDESAHFGQWKAQMACFQRREYLGLRFRFKDPQNDRQHNIRIYEVKGRCIFLAQAAIAEVTNSLDVDQLINLTWVRNRNIDLHFSGCVWNKIQITFRILIENINRWWSNLVTNSESRKDCFNTTRSTE